MSDSSYSGSRHSGPVRVRCNPCGHRRQSADNRGIAVTLTKLPESDLKPSSTSPGGGIGCGPGASTCVSRDTGLQRRDRTPIPIQTKRPQERRDKAPMRSPAAIGDSRVSDAGMDVCVSSNTVINVPPIRCCVAPEPGCLTSEREVLRATIQS
jgi:hypothetical protein